MAKVKLNSMPDYTANMPKSPHDVSQSTGFTCPPGQISPVYFDMLHLGDELHFSASLFARMSPLHTQALGDIEMHLDYFFVPLTVLYTPASSMFYQTDDLISSNFTSTNVPLFSTTDFPVWKPMELDGSGKTFFDNARNYFARAYQDDIYNSDSFDCYGKQVFRLFDFFDMYPYALMQGTAGYGYPSFTPWFALAYQAIYQLHPGYRNFDREQKDYIYNIDDCFSDGTISAHRFRDGSESFRSIFALHYINQHKDYFQSVKVSPMGSAVSMLKDPGEVFNSVNNWLNNSQFRPGSSIHDTTSFGSATQTLSYDDSLSSNNIRQLFMVDKLLRVIGRAEKNYESQFLAHYGIKIPHDELHNITHIGHDMTVMSPSAVISTADTWNDTHGSALGEIGGQGSQMLTGRKYNFKAPFHGVFMCLAYFKPRFRYQVGLSKLHQLNSITDFWQPEFDKKGMQPLFQYETMSADAGTFDSSTRLGWQFAYEQFKRKYDRITWAFAPSSQTGIINSYSPWFMSALPFKPLEIDGSVVRTELPNVNAATMKVAPTSLNGIFQVPYDPRWSDTYLAQPWMIYARDPFICDFNMHCKKVNGMSEYGEPEL